MNEPPIHPNPPSPMSSPIKNLMQLTYATSPADSFIHRLIVAPHPPRNFVLTGNYLPPQAPLRAASVLGRQKGPFLTSCWREMIILKNQRYARGLLMSSMGVSGNGSGTRLLFSVFLCDETNGGYVWVGSGRADASGPQCHVEIIRNRPPFLFSVGKKLFIPSM